MSKKSTKLYDRYQSNLHATLRYFGISFTVIESKIDLDNGYMCPVTLSFYTSPLNEKLSVEHVPPKSIGGKVICLTDKKWNNNSTVVDHHVLNRIMELTSLYETGESIAKVRINDKLKAHARIKLDEKPKIRLTSKSFVEGIKPFDEFKKSWGKPSSAKVKFSFIGEINRMTKIGYLKNAYLLLFQKFGYSLIFGDRGLYNTFTLIRRQLRNPKLKILGDLSFVKECKKDCLEPGIYVVTAEKQTTVAAIFGLGNKDINLCGVFFPPLNTTSNEILEWDMPAGVINFTKIDNKSKFAFWQEYIDCSSALYTLDEYESECENIR